MFLVGVNGHFGKRRDAVTLASARVLVGYSNLEFVRLTLRNLLSSPDFKTAHGRLAVYQSPHYFEYKETRLRAIDYSSGYFFLVSRPVRYDFTAQAYGYTDDGEAAPDSYSGIRYGYYHRARSPISGESLEPLFDAPNPAYHPYSHLQVVPELVFDAKDCFGETLDALCLAGI